MKSIILRFRDLVTEDGGTISDHRDLIKKHGEVWWGWWMKQYEKPPIELFREIAHVIKEEGYYKAFLFNSGTLKLYRANIVKMISAPLTTRIGTPDFEKSPGYYHRGSYPAWFLLSKIEEISVAESKMLIMGFPTIDVDVVNFDAKDKYLSLLNKELKDLTRIRETDITLWEIEI